MAPYLSNSSPEEPVDLLNETLEPEQALADSLKPVPEAEQKGEEWVYPYPTDFKISEHPIDEYRDLEVSLRGPHQRMCIEAELGRL